MLPGKEYTFVILAGVALIAACALALRFWVAASPDGHRSVSWPIGLAGFACFLLLYQLTSALTFRQFAGHMIPVSRSDG
jgi:hypothetical protein